MNAVNFCYWLQGYFELNGIDGNGDLCLSADQVRMIQEHLQLVFDKKTSFPAQPSGGSVFHANSWLFPPTTDLSDGTPLNWDVSNCASC